MDFFSLPVGAVPGRDPVVGYDEFGNMIYQTNSGEQYINPDPVYGEPVTMAQQAEALGGFAKDLYQNASWKGALDLSKAIGQSLLAGVVDTVSAPARALRGEPVTMGDAFGMAGVAQLGGAAMLAPSGALRSGALRSSPSDTSPVVLFKGSKPSKPTAGEPQEEVYKRVALSSVGSQGGVDEAISFLKSTGGGKALDWLESNKQYITVGGGQPKRATQGVSVESKGQGFFDVFVDGKPAGQMQVTGRPGSFFMDDANLSKEFQGKGYGASAYDLIEQQIGENLIPSPIGLSDAAASFWRKRLNSMSPEKRSETVGAYSEALGSLGISQGRIKDSVNKIASTSPAQRIAASLREGRSRSLTDEDFSNLTAADESELFDLYIRGETGIDLPMDQASRMKRAQEMGFDTSQLLYHGTLAGDIRSLKPGIATNEFAVYSAKDPSYAGEYADVFRVSPEEPTPTRGANVIPLYSRGDALDLTDFPDVLEKQDALDLATRLGVPEETMQMIWEGLEDIGLVSNGSVTTYEFLERSPEIKAILKAANETSVDFNDNSFLGPEFNKATLDPRTLRSPTARFDPRLSHISNLTAANASPIVGAGGLAATASQPNREFDRYLENRR
jgi:hypothetical protein